MATWQIPGPLIREQLPDDTFYDGFLELYDKNSMQWSRWENPRQATNEYGDFCDAVFAERDLCPSYFKRVIHPVNG